jgi:hypothetical protein
VPSSTTKEKELEEELDDDVPTPVVVVDEIFVVLGEGFSGF